MTKDDKTKGPVAPEVSPDEELAPPIEPDSVVDEIHEATEQTLDEARVEDTKAVTLDELINAWETSENQNAVDKVRRLKMILMLVREKVDIDPSKVLIRQPRTMGGNVVGEAHGREFVELDGILFAKKFTADQLTILRHVLLHESLHMVKGIDNEGLTEIAAAEFSNDVVRDYKDLAQNVAQITTVLDGSEELGSESGIDYAVRMYSEGRYDNLYESFETEYVAQNPSLVAEDADAPFKVFQLAFPELKDSNGSWGVDEETINEFDAEPSEPGVENEKSFDSVSAKARRIIDEATEGEATEDEAPAEG